MFRTILLLALGCFIAGFYGMLHNQISYTVSPEYFHQFKFMQFHIEPELRNRVGASLVGFGASWWMGIVIGLFIIPIARFTSDSRKFKLAVIHAYGIVALTALVTGSTALAIAYLVVDPESVGTFSRYGEQINNPVAFVRAGTMHNCSYLGGLLGIITAGIWLVLSRKKASR